MMSDNGILNQFNGLIKITDAEFIKISELVYSMFGINLTEKKRALVQGRLNKLIKTLGFSNFSEYIDFVEKDTTSTSLLMLIDRISTNHSYFFREDDHFQFLKDEILPLILKTLRHHNDKTLRVWCAGCATGEEAYTLAFILSEFFAFDTAIDIGILATDISISALQTAEQGIYSLDKIKKIPVQYRTRNFTIRGRGEYEVNDDIKKMILFKRLNLMRKEYPFKTKFHIVFLRNVMIYFDPQTRKNVICRIHKHMTGNSFLFVGHSENLSQEVPFKKYIKPAVYRRV